MCRFLLVKSKQKKNHQKLISQFAKMCKNSQTLDDDWQGDGWGVSWLVDNHWQTYRSLKPIWQDTSQFAKIPETNMLAVHARSASFPHHKDKLEFNQPYIRNNYLFVFNGLIKGVRFEKPVAGEIGAQKIFNLLLEGINENSTQAINKTYQLIAGNSKEIKGFNLGFSDGKNFYVFSEFTERGEYFRLRLYNGRQLKMVCSEEIGDLHWKKISRKNIVKV